MLLYSLSTFVVLFLFFLGGGGCFTFFDQQRREIQKQQREIEEKGGKLRVVDRRENLSDMLSDLGGEKRAMLCRSLEGERNDGAQCVPD